ncbi:AAC(3) family N-acetyltransferase [Acrocarpospora sp. B8E8]|uniref:aminoglycoside N(3)-acetyltransferase n=1 Tax=Acrocarpospora sp. B8E8 TaxID=3153572 RepID=UPI00325D4CCF
MDTSALPLGTSHLTDTHLADDLRAMGLGTGQIVLVHSSLRAIGPLLDGARTLSQALLRVLGVEGTIVVPTFTSDNSDTSRAYRARTQGMDAAELARYSDGFPPFDKNTSSAAECGQFAEQLRIRSDAFRSDHPQTSFAAVGASARWLMADHSLDDHLGWSSPLAKLYQAHAVILLLGVGYECCSAFHLAEYGKAVGQPLMQYRCRITVGGMPIWHQYDDVVLDDSDFGGCGTAIESKMDLSMGHVGAAPARLFPLRQAVDFTEKWLTENRSTKNLNVQRPQMRMVDIT